MYRGSLGSFIKRIFFDLEIYLVVRRQRPLQHFEAEVLKQATW